MRLPAARIRLRRSEYAKLVDRVDGVLIVVLAALYILALCLVFLYGEYAVGITVALLTWLVGKVVASFRFYLDASDDWRGED